MVSVSAHVWWWWQPGSAGGAGGAGKASTRFSTSLTERKIVASSARTHTPPKDRTPHQHPRRQ
eukprot:2340042-Pyramimonas_sp.AAC.1